MATVRIPPILRPEAGGNRQLELEGATVREVLENLTTSYPALRNRIFAGDELPQFLNVFVDGSDIRLTAGLETEVSDASATVILLPAVAGGRRPGPDGGTRAARTARPLPPAGSPACGRSSARRHHSRCRWRRP